MPMPKKEEGYKASYSLIKMQENKFKLILYKTSFSKSNLVMRIRLKDYFAFNSKITYVSKASRENIFLNLLYPNLKLLKL